MNHNGHDRLRRDVALMQQAAAHIGAHLDVQRTAQDIADVLVPALGDLATVDLGEMVTLGDEPPLSVQQGAPTAVVRAAVSGDLPPTMIGIGAHLPHIPRIPPARLLRTGEIVCVPEPYETLAAVTDEETAKSLVPPGARLALSAPLHARGITLGAVTVFHVDAGRRRDDSDIDLLREIVSRGALAIDNARRFTHERRVAETLQRQLLPRRHTETATAETAAGYVAAGMGAAIGGDWYDAIPLSSGRLALVVGDVFGRGLAATATMARLRTAVLTLADLDLAPDELLTHLDDLVQRLAVEAGTTWDRVGATCLYAIYDPILGDCSVASAGHPPPIAMTPGGKPTFVDINPGPPLGVGGMPFEVTSLPLPPGTVLALYTDGLTDRGSASPEGDPQRIADELHDALTDGRSLEDVCAVMLAGLQAGEGGDDATLLLAKTRGIVPENTATWAFPADPQVVGAAREAVSTQLERWGLDELAFMTELVISELVTNSLRYASGPIGVRLIRDQVLICEVTDPSNTQPRLRRAKWTDEGGRGLFLVAQVTDRWGCRYGQQGKTIWTEQALPGAVPQLA
ncbi:SpoIIE family protein phosphatase [Yinghuangia sp. YIM S09857]|uniref:SpoIIE family protein phosphatase n=1 Tax=Yinghuangia sp. YIM S09857 TaxID=3436929 RepID=UPI003F538148